MSAPQRLAVLGLGNLGIEVAHAIAASGHEVVPVDPDASRRAVWSERSNVIPVERLEPEAFETIAAVFVCVRLPEQAHAVLRSLPSDDGSRPAFVLTTLRVSDAEALPASQTRGWRAIESPVSGGAERTRRGDLTVLVAGALEDGDVALLERTIASRVFTMEELGQPSVAKLVNNVLAAYNVAAFAALAELAAPFGIDAERMHEVVSVASGASWITTNLPVVVMDLLVKDLALAEDAFGALPAVAPVAGVGLEAQWVALQKAVAGGDA